LLNEKEGSADVNRIHSIERRDGLLFDRREGRNASVGDQDIQAITDNSANLRGEGVRAIGCG
jgi:hypothetical protein